VAFDRRLLRSCRTPNHRVEPVRRIRDSSFVLQLK
jgi:hypothetical protein